MLRQFLRWLSRTLIVLVLVSLVFSGVNYDINSTLKELFRDVFAYSSKSAQNEAMGRLIDTCDSVSKGAKLVTMHEICTNATLLDKMKQNCANYRNLREQGIKIENEGEIRQSCLEIESGELENTCANSKGIVSPNLEGFGTLCSRHDSGELDDSMFFAEFLSSPLGNQDTRLPQVKFFERMNRINSFLLENMIIYLIVLVFSIIILHRVSGNSRSFVIVLGGAFLSAGFLILLPYGIIVAYDTIIGIDTTFILNSIYSYGTMIEPKSITSLVLLLFLRMYTNKVLIWGFAMLSAGIVCMFLKSFIKEKEPRHY